MKPWQASDVGRMPDSILLLNTMWRLGIIEPVLRLRSREVTSSWPPAFPGLTDALKAFVKVSILVSKFDRVIGVTLKI